MATVAPGANLDDGPTWLGHPRGLFVLFFAELWERFCYYGMRALLVFYVAQQFFAHLSEDAAKGAASESYGGFTALIYALGIFGGTVADRVLGYRRSIITGGIFMAIGEFMLMTPKGWIVDQRFMFFMGLAAMIVGNGLFKPNISTLVGKLYKPGDVRRDSGFTIFYMGINIGAALAPLLCAWISYKMGVQAIGTPGEAGYVAAIPDYRYGFMLAGAGMLLGLACFASFLKVLGDKGLPPKGKEGVLPIVWVVLGCLVVIPGAYFLLRMREDFVGYALYATFAIMAGIIISVALKEELQVRQRMFALVLLVVLNCIFWIGFEQAGNSLNFFARDQLIPLSVGAWTMKPEDWQSVNAILIVIFGPVFAALWIALQRRNLNPSIPAKFGMGFLGMGLGFLVINQGIGNATAEGKILWAFLLGLYVVHTLGELCISPVGLSMVTKLAPARMTGMVMGTWFISIATGNFLAAKVSTLAANNADKASDALGKIHAYGDVFTMMVYLGVGVGITVIVSSKLVNKWMHGVN